MADKDTKHWLYAGGLPYELTEGDVICVFSQFGEILQFNLSRDRDTGKSRGFGFIKYEDPRSCELAVDNFNGATVVGRRIKVSFANNTNSIKTVTQSVAPNEGSTLPIVENINTRREVDRNLNERGDLASPDLKRKRGHEMDVYRQRHDARGDRYGSEMSSHNKEREPRFHDSTRAERVSSRPRDEARHYDDRGHHEANTRNLDYRRPHDDNRHRREERKNDTDRQSRRSRSSSSSPSSSSSSSSSTSSSSSSSSSSGRKHKSHRHSKHRRSKHNSKDGDHKRKSSRRHKHSKKSHRSQHSSRPRNRSTKRDGSRAKS